MFLVYFNVFRTVCSYMTSPFELYLLVEKDFLHRNVWVHQWNFLSLSWSFSFWPRNMGFWLQKWLQKSRGFLNFRPQESRLPALYLCFSITRIWYICLIAHLFEQKISNDSPNLVKIFFMAHPHSLRLTPVVTFPH